MELVPDPECLQFGITVVGWRHGRQVQN